ncbi:MAG: hypothetical protein ABJF04_11300 [Reichenbachiella sp.]|uniref:hypothetical protein n=1 Tax=Reichenbachiella sp. TaxID=2184521 RepID=UPI0032655F4E
MNSPVKISAIHAIMGLLTFVTFLQTGWYMEIHEIGNLPDAQRMIYRAGHIYFLFSGMLNLSIGLQLKLSVVKWKKNVQYIGSTLLLFAPIALLIGFYHEATLGEIDRLFTALGVFSSLGGTALHSLIFLFGFLNKKEE